MVESCEWERRGKAEEKINWKFIRYFGIQNERRRSQRGGRKSGIGSHKKKSGREKRLREYE